MNARLGLDRRFSPLMLRVRLFVLVVLSVLPVVGMILYADLGNRAQQEAEVREETLRINELISSDHRGQLEAARQLLVALSRVPQVTGEPRACSTFLAGLREEYTIYANLGVAGADGFVRCSALPTTEPVAVDDRPWFQRAVRTGGFAVGDYQIGRITKKPTLNFGYAVRDESGTLGGVIFAALDLAWMSERAAEARLPHETTLTVFDTTGTILARYPNPEDWVGRSIPQAGIVRTALSQGSGVAEVAGFDGRRRVYAISALPPGASAYVTIGIPNEVAFASADRFLTRSLVGTAIGLLLAFAAAWVIGGLFVVEPVRRAFETEREAADAGARVAAIVESSDDAIFSVTPDGFISSWNRGAEWLYGYTAAEAIGRPIDIVVPAERIVEEQRILDRVLGGERLEQIETEHRGKSGRHVNVSMTTSPIRDGSGAVVGASTIARDVTERLRAERELRRYAAELERSNKELEEFAYVASHDLQEPLRMVTSYVQLLQRRYGDRLDADADEFMAFAVDGALRMQQLIQDLLAYSRAGRTEEPAEPIALEDMVRAAANNLRTTIQESGAVIESEDLPTVIGRRSDLVQLLQNLLANALKFRADRSPRITIRSNREPEGWTISVSDNGIGIAPEHRDRIFQIFQRLHHRGQHPGTGIGLAICKKVVERYGGRIWIESEPGKGATFSFTLPSDPSEGEWGRGDRA